jgi:hypothetical protein
VGTVPADGTFVLTRGITTAGNGGSNLRTGTDFTAVDTNFNAGQELIRLGTGEFLVNPGQTPVPAGQENVILRSTVTFNAEIQAGRARFGVPAAVDSTPANPTGANQNPFRDAFNIRPSANTPIFVNGNAPTTFPGDSLRLFLDPTITDLVFTPLPGQGNGMFTFSAGSRETLVFTSIEQLPQAGLQAVSVQTGPNTFQIVVQGTFGPVNAGNPFALNAPGANPFVVAPALVNPVQPFAAPRLSVANVNGDLTPDLIIGAGPGGPPLITVVDGATLFGTQPGTPVVATLLAQFFAYDPNFQGGVFVAGGDLNADGRAEIVTGADAGGGPHVRTFQYTGPLAGPPADPFNAVVQFGGPLGSFFAYFAGFAGGVRVAVGDVDGDGRGDIVTGAGFGGGPHVQVFSPTAGLIRSFFAFDPGFRGGVFVAAGDYDLIRNGQFDPIAGVNRFTADIVVGAGAGGGPHVKVISGSGSGLLTEFFAFGPDGGQSIFGGDLGLSTGVGSVSIGDVNGDNLPDVLVTTSRGPRTRLAAFRGNGPVV